MPTQQNLDRVDAIRDWIDRCTIAISTDYTGLSVADMTSLRKALRASGIEYRVIKNTLALLAADGSTKPDVKQIVEGPTALAFGYDDPLVAAKVLTDFVRVNRSVLKVRGGVMGERVLTAQNIAALAALPSKEQLLARLLRQLNAPMTGLVYVLSAPIAGLARVLRRHAESMPQAEASVEAETTAEEAPSQQPVTEDLVTDEATEEVPAEDSAPTEEPEKQTPASEEASAEAEPVEATAEDAEASTEESTTDSEEETKS
ncbi:MAG: 50S ribosomal protein L10 [Chloroflexi bacterium]|nr:50S ribosomal protein L10 [Chloroflexota bacterium]